MKEQMTNLSFTEQGDKFSLFWYWNLTELQIKPQVWLNYFNVSAQVCLFYSENFTHYECLLPQGSVGFQLTGCGHDIAYLYQHLTLIQISWHYLNASPGIVDSVMVKCFCSASHNRWKCVNIAPSLVLSVVWSILGYWFCTLTWTAVVGYKRLSCTLLHI